MFFLSHADPVLLAHSSNVHRYFNMLVNSVNDKRCKLDMKKLKAHVQFCDELEKRVRGGGECCVVSVLWDRLHCCFMVCDVSKPLQPM